MAKVVPIFIAPQKILNVLYERRSTSELACAISYIWKVLVRAIAELLGTAKNDLTTNNENALALKKKKKKRQTKTHLKLQYALEILAVRNQIK